MAGMRRDHIYSSNCSNSTVAGRRHESKFLSKINDAERAARDVKIQPGFTGLSTKGGNVRGKYATAIPVSHNDVCKAAFHMKREDILAAPPSFTGCLRVKMFLWEGHN